MIAAANASRSASLLRTVLSTNDLGHALCTHLRQGLWLLDYYVNRIDWSVRSHHHAQLRCLDTGTYGARARSENGAPRGGVAADLPSSYFKCGFASEGLMAVRDWMAERFTVIRRLPQSLQLRFLAATILKVVEVATYVTAGVVARRTPEGVSASARAEWGVCVGGGVRPTMVSRR